MKKTLCILTIFSMIVLASCGSGGATGKTSPVSAVSQQSEDEQSHVSLPEGAGDITEGAEGVPEGAGDLTGQKENTSEQPATDSTYTTVYEHAVGRYNPPEILKGRAFTAMPTEAGVLLSWRSYGSKGEVFSIYRGDTLLYTGTLTNFTDTEGTPGDRYTLSYADNDETATENAVCGKLPYHEFTLKYPADNKEPNGKTSGHTANDMSVGDLDGDGELEIVLKWDATDSQDNSKDGFTGTTVLDAYKLDLESDTATLLWRIDLGLNIRSGAHYTQFQVWDYDGDGIAEVICKTADGTTTYDGDLNETGHVGAVSMKDLDTALSPKDQDYDYRMKGSGEGRILTGPEYLTVFDGRTGEIIDTADYLPARGNLLAGGKYDISSWGDTYGNRSDRFLAATAYIDEGSPAAIFCRGYYGRTTLSAWKLIDRKLTPVWYFDADGRSPYAGQGNHGLSVNDVDSDGLDEIIYGSLCLDNDGSVLYCTGLGHGDAMHVSDFNNDGKLDVFQVHENGGVDHQIELHDAGTGEILWGVKTGKDTGRGMAADIDPRYEGAEMWAAANGNTFDCNGNVIYEGKRPSINFSIFWDGDLLTELFDYNNQEEYIPEVQKWDYEKERSAVLLSASGTAVNNGTKGNPCLIADIYGDWREEIILRSASDPSKIRLYLSPFPTEYTAPCLLTERAYRAGIAWQNTAYNQPANLSVPLKDYVMK